MDMSRLPYQQTPAKVNEVIDEIIGAAAMAAGIVSAAHGDAALAWRMLEDATKEPGQSLLVQKTRAALALDSYVDTEVMARIAILLQSFGVDLPDELKRLIDEASG